MFYIEHTTDFEFFSSTSAGAIQGYGYVFHTGKSSAHVRFKNLPLTSNLLAGTYGYA